ncbi:hypothetical protein MP228_013147 [Amoeboaphelidium protococcarum]|nr:hypothetical protein MP228_013147 [Amoeboaphelidium protococcarum]
MVQPISVIRQVVQLVNKYGRSWDVIGKQLSLNPRLVRGIVDRKMHIPIVYQWMTREDLRDVVQRDAELQKLHSHWASISTCDEEQLVDAMSTVEKSSASRLIKSENDIVIFNRDVLDLVCRRVLRHHPSFSDDKSSIQGIESLSYPMRDKLCAYYNYVNFNSEFDRAMLSSRSMMTKITASINDGSTPKQKRYQSLSANENEIIQLLGPLVIDRLMLSAGEVDNESLFKSRLPWKHLSKHLQVNPESLRSHINQKSFISAAKQNLILTKFSALEERKRQVSWQQLHNFCTFMAGWAYQMTFTNGGDGVWNKVYFNQISQFLEVPGSIYNWQTVVEILNIKTRHEVYAAQSFADRIFQRGLRIVPAQVTNISSLTVRSTDTTKYLIDEMRSHDD